jgi:hypothetical protein
MRVPEQQIDVTLPSDAVRMLIVQPFLEFQPPVQEPFALTQACAQRLENAIDSTFAKVTEYHPRFVLFPEFSVPGLAAVEQITQHLASNTILAPLVVVAGVSGLSKTEYASLCARADVAQIDQENDPQRVQQDEWVNAAVTFVKDNTGAVTMWVQPKISPSWTENNISHQRMFRGGVVRFFRARFENNVACRFLSVLCFDWVGREAGVAVTDAVLQQFGAAYEPTGSPQDLNWVFVLQHNPSPNHATFLTATQRILTQPIHAFARCRDTGVVMACTASGRAPARRGPYGYSSLVFGPLAPFDSIGCRPTFATQSFRLRGATTLGTCKDVVFREMGECIHAAEVRIPASVVPNPTDRTAAIVQAEAIPLVGGAVDPRIPGTSVPAVVKWVNDELDEVPDLCAAYFAGNPLQPALRTSHNNAVDGYRRLPSQDLAIRVDGACAARFSRSSALDPAGDVDTDWDVAERSGLHHVIQTLTLVGGAAAVDIANSQLHARHSATGIEIAAISGPTHADCMQAFQKLAGRTHAPIVFVSRDNTNNMPHLPREVESFADPRRGAGVRLTDAQTLLNEARLRPQNDYAAYITELLNVQDRRVI